MLIVSHGPIDCGDFIDVNRYWKCVQQMTNISTMYCPSLKKVTAFVPWHHLCMGRSANIFFTCGYFGFCCHGDVIKRKHFPHYWPFLRGIHRWPVSSPHKCQWRGTFIFHLICDWIKRLSKQSCGWWFETPSRPLYVTVMRHRSL